MKPILIALSLMLYNISVSAQLTKNTWLVGGEGSFYADKEFYNSSTYNTIAKYTRINISPSIGYFIIDKLSIGLRPSFSSIKGEVTSVGGLRTNTRHYLLGPFVRYYFLEMGKPFNLLTDLSYQYGISTLDNKKIGSETDFSVLSGPVIYFNTVVGIEFLFGYSSSNLMMDNSFSLIKRGFLIAGGFQIHLEK